MTTSARHPGSPAALRRSNRERIVDALRAGGELSQSELSRQTGLAPSTVSNIVSELERAGQVARRSSGRRRLAYLTQAAGFVAGIDCGHRHMTVAVADRTHDIWAEERADMEDASSAAEGIALAAELLTRVLDTAGVERDELLATAIGLPGPVVAETALVGSPTILPGWAGQPIRELAATALELATPIVVDNDANFGALAEHRWGAGVGVSDMVYLKLSEGVGAGLIVNGREFSGYIGTAGEIGHIITDEMGELCRCGNRGCLETVVAARQVTARLAPTHGADLTISDVVALADGGDRLSAKVLEETGRKVGAAIADLCSMLNPELVVVGGELGQAGDYLLPSIKESIERHVVSAAARRLRVVSAALGAKTHILGAIAAALDATSLRS